MDKLGSFIGWFNANWMQTWPSFRRSRPSLYADRYRERDTTPLAIIECPPTTDMGLLTRSPCDGCTDRLWLQPQKFVSAGSQQHRHFRHFDLVLRGAAALEATQDQVKSCSVLAICSTVFCTRKPQSILFRLREHCKRVQPGLHLSLESL